MKTGYVVAGVAAMAAALGAVVWRARKKKPEAAPPVPQAEVKPSGAAAPKPVPAANVGAPKPSAGNVGGEVAAKVAGKALDVAFGASAATVKMGIQAADLQRQVMTKVAGEGVGNAAVLNPMVTVGFAAKRGAEELGKKLGLPAEANRRIAQTVGVAVGAPALLPFKVTGEVVSLGIRGVLGKKAEADVRGVFKKLDISDSKNAIHKPVAALGKGVSAVANVLKGGLFKKK
jgi:hypothetical protein